MNPQDAKDFILQIGAKLDSISEDITELKVTAAKQEINLQEHMKRSELLEEQVDLINSEVRPILEGLSFLKKVAKFAVGLATIIKAISFFWK